MRHMQLFWGLFLTVACIPVVVTGPDLDCYAQSFALLTGHEVILSLKVL